MLPLRHVAVAFLLSFGLIGLPAPAQASTYAVPPATASTVSANRNAATVYDQYATHLATISKARKAVSKYSASTVAVTSDQARIDGYTARSAAATAQLAAWRVALAQVSDPATFTPAPDNPIADALTTLAAMDTLARIKRIKKAIKTQRKVVAKANKGLRKYRRLLKRDLAKQAKDAPRLAAAQAVLDQALADAPGVEQQYQDALAALNAITGMAALNPALPRGIVQPINPGPACVPGQQVGYETVFECGKVTKVLDGDTVIVKTTAGDSVMVRNSVIQATEVQHLPIPAQCYSWKAKSRLQDLLMPKNSAGTRVGVTVQLRALFADSVNLHNAPRPYRTVYAFDPATGGFTLDVQKDLAARGLVLWFPVYKPGDPARETYHHGEYLDDINQAAAQGLGLYNPTACGSPVLKLPDGTVRDPQFDITPLLHVSWLDSDEYIDIKNPSTRESLDLSRWKLRNKNLDYFTFPDGSVLPPLGVGRLYTRTIPVSNTNPFVWAWNKSEANINTPGMITCSVLSGQAATDCATYNQGWLMGTGVYLLDYQAGTDPATGYLLGGNLRAFAHVPCNYTYLTNSIGSSSVCNAAFSFLPSPKLDTTGVVGVDQETALATLAAAGYLDVRVLGTGTLVTAAVLTYTGFNQSRVTLTLGS